MHDLIGHRPAGAALVGVAEENRGRILRANRALASLLGSTPNALVGTRLSDHIHPSDRARALTDFLRLVGGTRTSFEGRFCLLAADGRGLAAHAYASLVGAGTRELVLVRFLPVGA